MSCVIYYETTRQLVIGSDEFRISHVPGVSYQMLRILTPWCQNPYCKVPVSLLNKVQLLWAQTTALQGQRNSGPM